MSNWVGYGQNLSQPRLQHVPGLCQAFLPVELARAGAENIEPGTEHEVLQTRWREIGGTDLVEKNGKQSKEKFNADKYPKKEKIEIRKETKEEEIERKDAERKSKVDSINEKMMLGGVNMQGEEMGPTTRDRMLRLGSLGSADNHAMMMENLGINAIFSNGAGFRDEDEPAEGAAGGFHGVDKDQSGKYIVCIDDTCLYTPTAATQSHITHMTDSLNVMIERMKKTAKLGKDRSSRKAVIENVGRISRVGQQAILKALASD